MWIWGEMKPANGKFLPPGPPHFGAPKPPSPESALAILRGVRRIHTDAGIETPSLKLATRRMTELMMQYAKDVVSDYAETPSDYRRRRRNHCPHHHCHPRSHLHFRVRHHRRHCSLPTTLSRRPARAGPPWHRHHRLHRRFPRPAAAAAVTPVAAIVPATILAATAGAAERCDVCEGLLALPPPV